MDLLTLYKRLWDISHWTVLWKDGSYRADWVRALQHPEPPDGIIMKGSFGLGKDRTMLISAQRIHDIRPDLPLGVYGWWLPDLNPIQQADVLCDQHEVVARLGKIIIPSVDVEQRRTDGNKRRASDDLHKVVDRIYNRLGIQPMIYTSRHYWLDVVMGRNTQFGGYNLWVAHYTEAPNPYIPPGWNAWDAWQRRIIKVAGLPGSVDFNHVKEHLLSNTPPVPLWPKRATVTATGLWIRSGPRVNAQKVGSLTRMTGIEVYEEILVDHPGSNQKDVWLRINDTLPYAYCAMLYADNEYVRYV